MRQVLHIFKKDFRYLMREVALMLVLSAALVWMATRGPGQALTTGTIELLLVVTACFLIARVIHAEAIPGHTQFWLTRPYRWRSLLAAKILFIVAFVNVPMLLAQLALLLIVGFPLAPQIPGLLWCQALLFAGIAVPICALSAVTSGLVSFAFSSALLLAIGLMLPGLMRHTGLLWFGSVEWIRDSVALTSLIVFSVLILYWQYKRRITRKSRIAGLAGVLVATAAFAFIPLGTAFDVQSRLSKRSLDQFALTLSLNPNSKGPVQWQRPGVVEVDLPIKVSGLPSGLDIKIDAAQVILRGADGKEFLAKSAEAGSLNRTSAEGAEAMYHYPLLVDRRFFERNRNHTVKLAATLYFTAFGNDRSRTIRLSEGPVQVDPGLRCNVDVANTVGCASAFRWPAQIVEARTGGGRGHTMTSFISYSPFPAKMMIDPIEVRWAPAFLGGLTPSQREVTIVIKEPLSHVRRDLRIDEFRLTDFAFSASVRR
jgi:hypothetical protein